MLTDQTHCDYAQQGDARICVYINKRINTECWEWKCPSGNLTSIQFRIKKDDNNPTEGDRTVWIHNAYNPSPASDTSQDNALTIPLLATQLEKEGKHTVVGDFNLHNPNWSSGN